jgi:hypothetical protein
MIIKYGYLLSDNISNILNSKNNTKNLHNILKEYLNKN